ncbi:MAG: hypothetical protein JKY66_09520 [Spongiibacteraceae bacterium]|nr:hypothetical protein [Spongiibacteraceae bacterium]
MTDAKQSMFSDRRRHTDRRTQSLSMPAGMDRRVGSRRSKHFESQPWWLRIDYASELVSEKLSINNTHTKTDKTLRKNNPLSES